MADLKVDVKVDGGSYLLTTNLGGHLRRMGSELRGDELVEYYELESTQADGSAVSAWAPCPAAQFVIQVLNRVDAVEVRVDNSAALIKSAYSSCNLHGHTPGGTFAAYYYGAAGGYDVRALNIHSNGHARLREVSSNASTKTITYAFEHDGTAATSDDVQTPVMPHPFGLPYTIGIQAGGQTTTITMQQPMGLKVA